MEGEKRIPNIRLTEDMKTIYILLTKSNRILSRLIYVVTKDSYTHVSISFEENLQTLYSSSRKNGRTLFPAGPCTEQLQYGYYKNNTQIPCALYELQVSDEIYRLARQEVQEIMKNEQEYHYNIMGLLLCQFNISFQRSRHFFCSQFVSEVLSKSRALKLPKDTSLMKPSDYMELPELVCRFQGQLYELAERQLASVTA